MRVAVVSDAVYPWHTGGKEVRYEEILTRLAAMGVDLEVYTMHWWGEDLPDRDGIRFTAISPNVEMYTNGRRSIWQGVRFALACLKLLTVRTDVIEADHMPYLQMFPLWLVAKLRRKPLVVTWHEYWGTEYWLKYLGRAGRLAALLERVAAKLPTSIVAVSDDTARALAAAGVPQKKVTVLVNGVHAESDARRVRNKLAIVGRLIEHKHVEVAIEALALLRARGCDLHLDVIGDGPERENLERLIAELDLTDSVNFLGVLPSQQHVWDRMAAAAVLVAPSEREGFGLAVGEALLLGTPVVVADHPDNAARILVTDGETGEHAPARDAAAFADAISRVLHYLPHDVAAGFRAAHPELSWDASAAGYLELYRRLSGETR